jgi:hypothetical protein
MGPPFSEYDPTVALTALIAVTLAWYASFTREAIRADRERRTEERASLATAALAECRPVIARLRQLHQLGRPHPWVSPATWLAHPMLGRVADRPELFARETMQAVGTALPFLQDVLQLLEAMKPHSNGGAPTPPGPGSPELSTLQITAGWAHNRVVAVVQRLRAEGGLMPIGGHQRVGEEMPLSLKPELVGSPYGEMA